MDFKEQRCNLDKEEQSHFLVTCSKLIFQFDPFTLSRTLGIYKAARIKYLVTKINANEY